jgi:hypothetical protein
MTPCSLVDSELLGLWTLSIIRYSTLENKTFGKLDLFLSSGRGGGGRHLLGWVPYKELTSITAICNIVFWLHIVYRHLFRFHSSQICINRNSLYILTSLHVSDVVFGPHQVILYSYILLFLLSPPTIGQCLHLGESPACCIQCKVSVIDLKHKM